MRFIISTALLLLVSVTGAAQAPGFKIADLGWITGCWQSNRPTSTTTGGERWAPIAGNMMMGISQTVKGEKTVEFEFLRIVQDGTQINYIAKPSASPGETSFRLIKLANNEAVFENPAHDFPQRVIYRRDGTNLFARIEGKNGGKEMGMDFPMVRIKCE